MKYKEFENNLSQKLNAEEINVDTASLIEAIHKGSKNKSYNYFFGFFGIVALGLITAWVFNFNSQNDTGINNELHSNSLNTNNISGNKNNALNNITSQELINNTTKVKEESQDLTNKKLDAQSLNTEASIKDNLRQKSKNVITANPSSFVKETNASIEYTPNTKKTNVTSSSAEILIDKKTIIETQGLIETPASDAIELDDRSVEVQNASPLKRSLINVSSLTSLDNELSYERTLEYEAVECPDFLTGGVKVAYNIEAGIFFADKALLEKEEENEEMFLLRKDKERTLESLNIASSAIIKKENGPFYITAGVSYTRIAEQMKLDHNWTEYDTTIGIISTTTSPTGDTITVVMGEIIKEINYQRNSVDHYYIHLVDLPFGLGLENHRGNFIYGIDAGVQLNLYTHSKGRFYRNVASYTELPNENVFRTAIGISYYGSMRMGLKLNYNSSVYLAGKVRFIPGDFAANNNNISQYYTLYGINAGYRYSF